MTRTLIAVTLILNALAFTGCATRMNVGSHVQPELNTAQYRTYNWGPADALPTGDPRLDRNPFFQDHVQGAVEKQMAVKGIERMWSGSPDLLIHIHAGIAQRINPNQADLAGGYCTADNCPGLSEYEAGTLVLDMIDARTNRLVWRAWAQNNIEPALENSDELEKVINEAVTRMFAKFPAAL
jgi:uncharacterized protein DUF4136